jgi:hypothetical protein
MDDFVSCHSVLWWFLMLVCQCRVDGSMLVVVVASVLHSAFSSSGPLASCLCKGAVTGPLVDATLVVTDVVSALLQSINVGNLPGSGQVGRNR